MMPLTKYHGDMDLDIFPCRVMIEYQFLCMKLFLILLGTSDQFYKIAYLYSGKLGTKNRPT